MKKILCTLAVVGLASSLFAQGTVSFANSSATLVKFLPLGADPSAATSIPKNGGYVQVLFAPTGTAAAPWDPMTQSPAQWLSANPGWLLNTTAQAIASANGRFNTGVLTLATPTKGQVVDVMIAAWNGTAQDFGAAWTAAGLPNATVGVGLSGVVKGIQTGDPTNPLSTPGTLPNAGAGAFGGVIATPVPIPEPSTFALAGLGAAALMIFRRRK